MTGEPVAAVANPNIALIKYWGKRDEALHLPTTTSLSLTLREFPTTTTVTVVSELGSDRVSVAGEPAPDAFAGRVSRFLDLVRELSGDRRNAVVDTVNTVPTGAGLASSAAGFAALATAASAAYGLDLDRAALSRLARRGSGSAARSICGGFAVWWRGDGLGAAGDRSSFAEPIDAPLVTPALVVAVVDDREKRVSSREAMRRTVSTSPFYRPWVETSAHDLSRMMCALRAGDLATVGEIAEANALGMHATMLGARPAVRYLAPASLRVLDRVLALRAAGIGAWATMDAGPNVKVLCDRRDSAVVAEAIAEVAGEPGRVVVTTSGPGAALAERRSASAGAGPNGLR
ncbi:diphosphomevalonate decarboxylase [Nocardia blacklockiae]|uniref:diphosphomevalonate decarboxylase n=1 Tax=Nocardia blacklockiae TaxID=480036 RepID=UPI001893A8B7|nr:diphosphomevalonate decarboxylase [Nocardia blacklockiae]MBF6169866.1 diphosphomevalonate decarboxylase [Nocardia blacklockiae]